MTLLDKTIPYPTLQTIRDKSGKNGQRTQANISRRWHYIHCSAHFQQHLLMCQWHHIVCEDFVSASSKEQDLQKFQNPEMPTMLNMTKQSTHNHTNQQKILLYKVEYLKKLSSAIHLQHFSAHFHLSHSITLCNLQECNQQHIPAIRHPPPPAGYLIYI